jgi:hypothetical protein
MARAKRLTHGVELVVRDHCPEPAAGSIRTADGEPADLFDTRHYPVRATCRVCGESIAANGFLQPFRHIESRP